MTIKKFRWRVRKRRNWNETTLVAQVVLHGHESSHDLPGFASDKNV
jgi:hypothetical protein